MKKVAVIGFGGHVEKNVLSAFSRSSKIDIDAIYVRDYEKYKNKASECGIAIKLINDGVGDDVEWVYISTPISTHYDLSKKYLELGKNVICEKPLTDAHEKTKKLLILADSKGLRLHEVCMYHYHKQYEHLREFVSNNIASLKSLSTKFTIPHLPKDDIRYKKELGGGALLDVGYYPVSLVVSLLGKPASIKFKKYSSKDYDVDLSGIAIFEYDKYYCVAEWGIGLPYSNEVTVVTEKQVVKYDRIFSKPETFQSSAEVKMGMERFEVKIGSDDHFVNMFEAIILDDYSIEGERESDFISDLSSVLDDLKNG